MIRKFSDPMLVAGMLLLSTLSLHSQEVWFFTEGTGPTYYDQGIVNVAGLGSSSFEYTYPPGLPQYNDKIPCSSTAFRGSTSLKFNYMSSAGGNWLATVYRSDWTTADVSSLDSISMYINSAVDLPSSALPLIGLRAKSISGTGEASSEMHPLSDYNGSVPAGKWVRITFPLKDIMTDGNSGSLKFSSVLGIIFSQSESNGSSRTILIDDIAVFRNIDVIPPVANLSATGYDSHAELTWDFPAESLQYRIYASYDGGKSYVLRGETSDSVYLDFVPSNARNSVAFYHVVSVFQAKESQPAGKSASLRDFTSDELLDMVQRYTFRYFWEGSRLTGGMAPERTNGDPNTVASGATGMGLLSLIVAYQREYRPREEIKDRILQILYFLQTCNRHHGAWSHWYYANSGRTKPFSSDDDGGDLVETSYVAAALLALKNYFTDQDSKSFQIRARADQLWKSIEWNWYRQNGQNVLYWHWSPNTGFSKNMKITGWEECLITYIMAASSRTSGIPAEVYKQGWARNGDIVRSRTFYNYKINLSPDWGGPLFWIQYSHLALDPRDLKDQYADYWNEYVNTANIQWEYAKENPAGWKNFSENCWGLTASDDPYGYSAHQPVNNDNGTISPTAALSSMPYTPDNSLAALIYFYRERGNDLFGKFGFYDAFNDDLAWVAKSYVGIDEGPIVIMLENHRTGLLWNTLMKDADIQWGLNKLGFEYRTTSVPRIENDQPGIEIFPNPVHGRTSVRLNGFSGTVSICIYRPEGSIIKEIIRNNQPGLMELDCTDLRNGIYLIRVSDGLKTGTTKLLIQK